MKDTIPRDSQQNWDKDSSSSFPWAIDTEKKLVLIQEDNSRLRQENQELQTQIQELVEQIVNIEREIDIFSKHECSIEISTDGIVMSVNDFMLELSWFTRGELIWKNMRIMNSWVHSEEFWKNFWTTILSGRVWAWDICNRKKDGTFFWLWTLIIPKISATWEIISFKATRQDISESYFLRQKFDELDNVKNDHLTWLPNFQSCIEHHSEPKKASIVILHINNIPDINAIYGKTVGNKVLKDISILLNNYAESNKKLGISIYKFEWSDFAVVYDAQITEDYIKKQFETIKNLSLSHESSMIHLSFSLWVALDESDINTLIKIWYLALKNSRYKTNQITFTQGDTLLKEFAERLKIRNQINRAFKENLFAISKQEIRSTWTTEVQKRYECFVRLYISKEKKEFLLPGKFLPIIQEEWLNTRLTLVVVKKVCEHMSRTPWFYSINLTADDLYSIEHLNEIHSIIREYLINPRRITFEILEEVENIESEIILRNINILKWYGYKIAIDDFWSGFSNFSRLLDLRLDDIKIDMKYIRWIDTNPQHKSLIRAITMFAHDNEIKIVAEGVETETEAIELRALWVDYLQWFLYSRPEIVE
jgi:PAS domain S-box-containing protein